jgi:hypothetical protein
MSTKEVTVSRAEADDPLESLKADLEAQYAAALEEAGVELAIAPPGFGVWNVWAFGPFQGPTWNRRPGRILQVNQPALVHIVVDMDPVMCANVTGFAADFQLNIFTSNTQTMQAVPGLSTSVCIPTQLNQCRYHYFWPLTPSVAACLYETNICARLCNCDGKGVPGYAAFVRWVWDYDPEVLRQGWGPGVRFDHPIRFGVFDPDLPCCP